MLTAASVAFVSPVWPRIFPEDKADRCYRMFQAADYLVNHQISSGLSLGIFDKEYQYKVSILRFFFFPLKLIFGSRRSCNTTQDFCKLLIASHDFCVEQ